METESSSIVDRAYLKSTLNIVLDSTKCAHSDVKTTPRPVTALSTDASNGASLELDIG